MRFLILGGTGFVGRHLCKSLPRDHEILVFSRRKPDPDSLSIYPSNVKFVLGDISSFEQVNENCKNIDCLINLSSTVIPSTSNRDPVYDVNTNLIGALNTLRASVDHGVKKYIFLSSGGTVYGSNDMARPHREIDPTDPICSYGVVKLSIEKYIHMFNVLYGLPYSIVRLSNPYGPEYSVEKPQGVIHHFISKIIKNQPISVWGDGSIERDFIYIDDVVSALKKAVHHGSSQSLLNIGSGIPTSVKSILEILKEVTGKSSTVIYEPSRACDVQKSVLNIDKAKNQLSWRPTISINEGIKMTYLDALNRF